MVDEKDVERDYEEQLESRLQEMFGDSEESRTAAADQAGQTDQPAKADGSHDQVPDEIPDEVPGEVLDELPDEVPAPLLDSGANLKGSGNELGDFDFGLESSESIPVDTRGDRSRLPVILVVLLLVVAVGIYFGFFRKEQGPAPIIVSETAPEPQPKAETKVAEPPFELPALIDSDAALRRMVGRLSSHPGFIRWALSENLIRRFVAAVENVANGVSPVGHLEPIKVEGAFETFQIGDHYFMNPQSYTRYDGIAGAIGSIDAGGAASLYSSFKPLLDEVYQDLGYPGGDFSDLLQRAMSRLASTPVITGQIQLEQNILSYEFADDGVEGLQLAQKQLLRTGPDNQRVILAKIREIAREIGISL